MTSYIATKNSFVEYRSCEHLWPISMSVRTCEELGYKGTQYVPIVKICSQIPSACNAELIDMDPAHEFFSPFNKNIIN